MKQDQRNMARNTKTYFKAFSRHFLSLWYNLLLRKIKRFLVA